MNKINYLLGISILPFFSFANHISLNYNGERTFIPFQTLKRTEAVAFIFARSFLEMEDRFEFKDAMFKVLRGDQIAAFATFNFGPEVSDINLGDDIPSAMVGLIKYFLTQRNYNPVVNKVVYASAYDSPPREHVDTYKRGYNAFSSPQYASTLSTSGNPYQGPCENPYALVLYRHPSPPPQQERRFVLL